MSSTQTIRLYNLLLKKGFDQSEAESFIEEVITRDEAKLILVTKDDMFQIERRLTSTMYQMAIGSVALSVAGMTVVLQIFFAAG